MTEEPLHDTTTQALLVWKYFFSWTGKIYFCSKVKLILGFRKSHVTLNSKCQSDTFIFTFEFVCLPFISLYVSICKFVRIWKLNLEIVLLAKIRRKYISVRTKCERRMQVSWFPMFALYLYHHRIPTRAK